MMKNPPQFIADLCISLASACRRAMLPAHANLPKFHPVTALLKAPGLPEGIEKSGKASGCMLPSKAAPIVACHQQAANGDFNEDSVRIPR